jgi:hypothetical protein
LLAAALAAATLTAPATAHAQFKVQYGGHFYENTSPSITTIYDTASHPLFPATISLTNLIPDQYTLDLTISPASNTNATNGSYVVGVFGEGIMNPSGSDPVPSANGAFLNVINNAALTLTNPQGQGAPLNVVSQGAPGNPNDGGNTNVYNAGQGAPVSVTNNGAIAVYGTAGDTGTTGPSSAGIWAESLGGAGAGNKANDTPFGGNGGNAGSVDVTMNPGASITLDASGTLTQPAIGIFALSQGGVQGQYVDTEYNVYGAPGLGYAVNVYNAGAIGGGAPYTIGIAAVSVGGSGGILSGGGIPDVAGLSGPGGQVQVTLASTGSIDLTSGNSIGVLAASVFGSQTEGGAEYYPGGCVVATSGNPCVSVTIAQDATIQTGSPPTVTSARFDVGVAAISSGSESIIQPFSSTTASGTGNGTSGPVTVSNAGSIATYGELAIGIAALSIGGSGLVTNDAGTGLSQLGGSATTSQSAGPGGAPPVQVTNSGSIITDGASAFGIIAISTGAGGLLGAESNATPNSNNTAWASGVSIGNDHSGAGYNAGAVTVTNSGTVITGDANGGGRVAMGIVAQSIGGGGGSTGGAGAAFLVGDSGGRGGNGGAVTVANTGTVGTLDDGAIGILAQSIGGGGGNGANAAGIFVAVGGNGGDGGTGGPVSVTLTDGGNTPTNGVTTEGNFAIGLLAQSVGGGGGNGGYGTSVGAFIADSIGGTGGSGGDGGNVTIDNGSTITTSGAQSLGILAQSIGGGGGNGGAANAYSAGVAFSISLAVGGSGGSAGTGGDVSLYNGHQITTTGSDAIGIVEQSIGGGGGNGGASTAKSLAIGLPDTPVNISFSASLGGDGGGGGNGGSVSLVDSGRIDTRGDGSHGILLQSIGGGGGNGGDSTSGADTVDSQAPAVSLSFALGAKGGDGGNGGTVTVQMGPSSNCVWCYSQITTGGHNAAGLVAQSIGGGGGNSTLGEASTGAPNLGGETGDSYGISIGLGAKAGVGGTGGTVSVNIASGYGNVGAGNGVDGSAYDYDAIRTFNAGSPGILAQSIGGGGGAAEGGTTGGSQNTLSFNLAVGGNAGAGSSGGAVTVDSGASIVTARGDSIGILAQSIGGGGGVAGSTDASAAINAAGQIQDVINTPSTAYSANVSVGGNGGGGGSGGSRDGGQHRRDHYPGRARLWYRSGVGRRRWRQWRQRHLHIQQIDEPDLFRHDYTLRQRRHVGRGRRGQRHQRGADCHRRLQRARHPRAEYRRRRWRWRRWQHRRPLHHRHRRRCKWQQRQRWRRQCRQRCDRSRDRGNAADRRHPARGGRFYPDAWRRRLRHPGAVDRRRRRHGHGRLHQFRQRRDHQRLDGRGQHFGDRLLRQHASRCFEQRTGQFPALVRYLHGGGRQRGRRGSERRGFGDGGRPDPHDRRPVDGRGRAVHRRRRRPVHRLGADDHRHECGRRSRQQRWDGRQHLDHAGRHRQYHHIRGGRLGNPCPKHRRRRRFRRRPIAAVRLPAIQYAARDWQGWRQCRETIPDDRWRHHHHRHQRARHFCPIHRRQRRYRRRLLRVAHLLSGRREYGADPRHFQRHLLWQRRRDQHYPRRRQHDFSVRLRLDRHRGAEFRQQRDGQPDQHDHWRRGDRRHQYRRHGRRRRGRHPDFGRR